MRLRREGSAEEELKESIMGIRNFDNTNFTIESYIGLRHNQVHINTLGNPPIIPKERDGLPQGNVVGPVISEQGI